jgi:4-hydroxyphenylacetate 3-monooxygenase
MYKPQSLLMFDADKGVFASHAGDTGTGIRTGAQYLEGLRDDRQVWMEGQQVKDVTAQPGLMRCAATMASFLDRQHEDAYKDTVTYEDSDGHRIATAFLPPKSKEDVAQRGRAYYEWATWSNGMFGRTPDYKNASVMAFAHALPFLSQGKSDYTDFAANMTNYYNYIRKNDRVLTHTLVNPITNHKIASEGKFDDNVALHVVKESPEGIVVRGARLLATLGPLADEIEVFPSTILKSSPDNIPFSFAFAIPIATPGLTLLCRDSYDEGKSNFDAPLASRYEEMDAVVIFDDVFVPWERIFIYGEPSLCNQAFGTSNAVIHMMHQVACGKLAKAEFLVSLMCAIAESTGKDRDLYAKNMIAEVMTMTETVRALLYSAEAQAHEDQYGNFVPLRLPLETSRNLFPKMYPRIIELIQLLGSSSLMATPTEADFNNALAASVEKYFQTVNLESRDRVALFRLAHDVAISGFGSRQCLYERFFFGPQAFMAAAYYDLYDKKPGVERVFDFLKQGYSS